jgi:hypothetical protein
MVRRGFVFEVDSAAVKRVMVFVVALHIVRGVHDEAVKADKVAMTINANLTCGVCESTGPQKSPSPMIQPVEIRGVDYGEVSASQR